MKKSVVLSFALLLLMVPICKTLASNINTEISSTPVFASPLQWTGNTEPTEQESAALKQAIAVFGTQGREAGIAALESFLNSHPQSPWAPSLAVSLAEYSRSHGAFSKALGYWEQGWNATKNSTQPIEQSLAVRAAAGWTRLLASLGRKDEVTAIFEEVWALHLPKGTYATVIEGTESGVIMMKSYPGESYRCGSLALGHLGQALHLNDTNVMTLLQQKSPDGGFSMNQLLQLSQSNGMDLVAVSRPPEGDIIVPSVVHWKLNHYAAIISQKGSRYEVIDPTFGGQIYLDKATIEAEASGAFLVPREMAPRNWRQLTTAECNSIHGKGAGNMIQDDNDTGPCASDDDSDPGSSDVPAADPSPDEKDDPGCPTCPTNSPVDPLAGMPVWSVSQPYMTVWLKDIPLRYRLASGDWMSLTLSYKQRGEDKGANIGSFGPKWECNWIDFLSSDGTTDYLTNHMAGGGLAGLSIIKTPEYKSALVVHQLNNPVGDISPHYSIKYYAATTSSLSGVTNYFLTSKADRVGRTTSLHYETNGTVIRLNNVVDRDGRTNVLAYGNATYPNLITAATNAYGQSAHFNYDSLGRLTNIVDAVGMSTLFVYDSNNNITSMVTPYGTTTFTVYSGISGTNYSSTLRRATLISEPSGDQQLYEYCDFGPTGTGSDGLPDTRQGYHWNRFQFADILAKGIVNILDMPDSYYAEASAMHFLHGNNTPGGNLTVSDTVQAEAGPVLPNGSRPMTSYTYQNEGTYSIGTLKRVTSVNTPLGGAKDYTRNFLGLATNITVYGGSAPASYTNTYDVTGRFLQTVMGPHGELVHGYGYATAITNLLTSDTNALGYVTSYTYDTNLVKLTSISFPSGLLRSNLYYGSGPSKGFLQTQIDVGFATNSFGFQYGNISAMTNALGLVTTYVYDNLNRLVSVTFPDATTISNVYDKLDIVGVKDRLNQWTSYRYNNIRQLTALTNVNQQVTEFDYCGCGALSQIIRYDGATPLVTTFQYDIAGNRTNAIFPDLHQLKYAYDADGQLASITDESGRYADFAFSQYGSTPFVNHTDLNGLTVFSASLDDYGRMTNVVNENGITIGTAYDFLNRMTGRIRYNYGIAEGSETFNYSVRGLTNFSDPLSRMTYYVRDALGRIVTSTNANGETNVFTYNAASEVLKLTDGLGNVTQFAYDEFGRLTNKVDGLGNVVASQQYDALSRLVNRWTPAKSNALYSYDGVGNLTNIIYLMTNVTGSATNLSFSYDGLNRLVSMIDAIGTTKFAWTPGNQLAQEDGPWENDAVTYSYIDRLRSSMSLSQPNSSSWTQTYGYDNQQRLNAVSSPAGSFAYGYDGNNFHRYNSLTLPGSAGSISQTFDGLGRLTATLSSPIVYDQIQYDYDAASEITNQTFYFQNASLSASSLTQYAYDSIGQLKSARGFESDGTIPRLNEQFGYAYDKANNLSARTNDAMVETFTLNGGNELSGITNAGSLTVAGNTTEFKGGYFSWGNPAGVTNVMVSGTGLVSGPAALYMDGTWARQGATPANGLNAYTAVAQDTYGRQDTNIVTVNLPSSVNQIYDLNGNLCTNGSRIFDYDSENQLVRITEPGLWKSEFVFDGINRRRIDREFAWQGTSWTQTNETRYLYDENLVVQERDINNSPSISYTRGSDLSGSVHGAAGVAGLLARSDNKLMASSTMGYLTHGYYHSDAAGNIVSIVNPNGAILARYKYDPFGNTVAKAGPLADANLYRFSSVELHANSGLYGFLYRFYDTHLQRWINTDPIKENGGLNLYTFVLNNPENMIDVFGLSGYPDNFIGPLQPQDVRGPFLPNQKPPGWNPEWPRGTDGRGEYTEGPDGNRFYPHNEDDSHWPHYDDQNGKRYPNNCKKPRPGQKKLKPDQSPTDPSKNTVAPYSPWLHGMGDVWSMNPNTFMGVGIGVTAGATAATSAPIIEWFIPILAF